MIGHWLSLYVLVLVTPESYITVTCHTLQLDCMSPVAINASKGICYFLSRNIIDSDHFLNELWQPFSISHHG